MNIQTVSTELLTESLLAIADLRRKYLGEPMITPYAAVSVAGRKACPLCILSDKDKNVTGATNFPSSWCVCPWIWFEGGHCCRPGSHYHDSITDDALVRIDRWDTAINEELAKRGTPMTCALAEEAKKEVQP